MAQAVRAHYAQVELLHVNPDTGAIIDRNDPTQSIKSQLRMDIQARLIADSNIPNTSGNPTVKAYILAEAASGYVLGHIDQYIIITYHQGDLNAATQTG